MKSTRGYSSGVFDTVADPVAEEIRVPSTQKIFLRGFPVIPFMGSGDTTLPFLRKLARLSSTHSACISNINDFVMGGGFDVITKKRTAFARRTENQIEVDETEFSDYVNWLEESFAQELNNVYDHAKRHFLNLVKYGNAYLEVVIWNQGPAQQMSVYNHDADRCLYLATDKDEPEVILISPYWYEVTGTDEPPDPVPAFPNYVIDGDGKLRTMIHTRVVADGRDWYGEPQYLGALYHAYGEIQRAQYNTENYASDFTGKVFFETFTGAGSDGFDDLPQQDSFWEKLKSLFTNAAGNRKRSILHREAPIDGKETHIHEFGRNADHEYHEAMARLDETKIIMAHGWHPALLGVQMPGQLGNNQVFEQAFRQKYYQVIKPWQDLQMAPFNTALKVFSEIAGSGEDLVSEYSLSLKNMYVDMLRETSQEEDEGVDYERETPEADEIDTIDEDIDEA